MPLSMPEHVAGHEHWESQKGSGVWLLMQCGVPPLGTHRGSGRVSLSKLSF